jgi:hypothetical protein
MDETFFSFTILSFFLSLSIAISLSHSRLLALLWMKSGFFVVVAVRG